MQIRFILDIFTSRRDGNGNTYSVAQLTSTRTGKSLWFTAHSDSNARIAVRQALNGDARRYHYTEKTVGYREVMSLRNMATHDESAITADVLHGLERDWRDKYS